MTGRVRRSGEDVGVNGRLEKHGRYLFVVVAVHSVNVHQKKVVNDIRECALQLDGAKDSEGNPIPRDKIIRQLIATAEKRGIRIINAREWLNAAA